MTDCSGISPWESPQERNGRHRLIFQVKNAVLEYLPDASFQSDGQNLGGYELRFNCPSILNITRLEQAIARRTGVQASCAIHTSGRVTSTVDQVQLVVTVHHADIFPSTLSRYSCTQRLLILLYVAIAVWTTWQLYKHVRQQPSVL
jgi:hypothetical protein